MALAGPLLDLSAPGGARLLSLRLLDELAARRERLGRHLAPETLHQFRVALRRLRTHLREYRAALRNRSPDRARRDLRLIARTTGACRDLEVQLAGLDAAVAGATPLQRPGYEWFRRRLRAELREARDAGGEALARDFPGAERRLRRALKKDEKELVRERRPVRTLAHEAADRLATLAAELDAGLGAVRGPLDQEDAHRARIVAKRLRYLLEPMADALTRSGGLARRLVQLQDQLGALHDAHVLAERVEALRQDAAAAERADTFPGLLAIGDRAGERRAEAFEALRDAWPARRRLALRRALEDAASALRNRFRPPPPAGRLPAPHRRRAGEVGTFAAPGV